MKRMPSPPWSVWPVVSGMSAAVMPIRKVPWASAGLLPSAVSKPNAVNRQSTRRANIRSIPGHGFHRKLSTTSFSERSMVHEFLFGCGPLGPVFFGGNHRAAVQPKPIACQTRRCALTSLIDNIPSAINCARSSQPLRETPRLSPIAIFSGSAHPGLAQEICAKLQVPLLPTKLKQFSNDCMEVQLQANCREQDVFLIQPLSSPVQDHLVELLLMLDAARGASAARITAVIPHYAYARSDKKDAPRISIGGRLVADLLVTAGANRVLAMTLHSPQVHGFFSVPVDHLHALDELAQYFQRYDLSNGVVVSPDLGNAKGAAAFARRLGVPVAAGAKERLSDTQVRISMLIGDVRDRDVIVLDDEIVNGGSILELLRHLREHKARSIRIACTHGIFANSATQRLAAEGDILEIVCTNTVPIAAEKRVPKLTVLSIAPALAEAMRRINSGKSVSALFHSETMPQDDVRAARRA